MMKAPLAGGLLLLSSLMAHAQGMPDACHVYLIDQKVAQKAFDNLGGARNEREQEALISAGVTMLGKFSTIHGEEELTTRTFRIPRSKMVITASVFYTDEIMPTKHGASMLLSLSVATRPQKNAMGSLNNASAEVPESDELDIVRVKQNVRVNGRSYLIGLQCGRPQKPSPVK
jgi:hypothetical protein